MATRRILSLGMSGQDVVQVKELLLALGCYDPKITRISKESFGTDTLRAVRRFQAQRGLPVSGVVDGDTYAGLASAAKAASGEPLGGEPVEDTVPVNGESAPQQADWGNDAVPTANNAQQTGLVNGSSIAIPRNISGDAAAAILPSCMAAGERRREVVLDALGFAFDPRVPRAYPISLYIWGGNLYNKDLKPNVITRERIASGAKANPQYYDGGRREMMERAVDAFAGITGADCSGGVVGLFRHRGLVQPGFDATANGFAASRAMEKISEGDLLSGDLLHRDGHLKLYVGGGYCVEWMGGAYGCQLSKLTDRRGWNFVTGKLDRKSPWTGFLRPSYYK